MIEALQDIEIASRLVGFDKYNKLHCNITPLAHDSEDYKLIERYLLNTHAPTHKVWFYFSSSTNFFSICRILPYFLFESSLPNFSDVYIYFEKNEGLVAGTGGSFCT
jgi:hypothetical protein